MSNPVRLVYGFTPFATLHRVKSAEFENVLVVFGCGWAPDTVLSRITSRKQVRKVFMAFDHIDHLSPDELVAIALFLFGDQRFTKSQLTSQLSSVMQWTFSNRLIRGVNEKLLLAAAKGYVVNVPGPRGGEGWSITEEGVAGVDSIELPSDQIQKKQVRDMSQEIQARANPGPLLVQLVQDLHSNFKAQWFVNELLDFWLNKGWLSENQVLRLSEVAGAHAGTAISPSDYVGRSPLEWRSPYLQVREQQKIDALARERARLEEARRQAAEAQQRTNEIFEFLTQLDGSGMLSDVDHIMKSVFPAVKVDAKNKKAAFMGEGPVRLRTCISAIAFGKPPSEIWGASQLDRWRNTPHKTYWRQLTQSPEYQAVAKKMGYAFPASTADGAGTDDNTPPAYLYRTEP